MFCVFAPVTVVGSGPNAAGAGSTCGLVVPKLELVGTMQVLLQTQRLTDDRLRIVTQTAQTPDEFWSDL